MSWGGGTEGPWRGSVEGTSLTGRLSDNTGGHFEASRFKLQLRDRQDARTSQGVRNDRRTPMAWGWGMDAEEEFRRDGNRVCNKERWNKNNKWGRSKISWM